MCNLLNSAMESKVTSKTSSLKALLLRAWRERWSDLQWGINIKTILPRGVSGDVHNLADCILQQALVGPGPNELVLSYLKHSLCSQLVSYAAVLLRISKYDAFHKSHCILSLLEFLEMIYAGITCRGKPEEDTLATSCLSIVYWLFQCYHYALTKAPQSNLLAPQPVELMDKPAYLLKELLSSDFICAMLHTAKHDNKDLYVDIIKKCQEIEKEQKTSAKFSVQIEVSLKKICNLEIENIASNFVKIEVEPITYCLQPLLAVQNLVNPGTETSLYISHLHSIQRLKSYSNARLYCEVIRACMMCLHDVTGTFKESHWGGFTFFKLPQILKELHASTLNGDNESFEYSQDVIDAFDLLLRYTPLLDKMDIVCAGNSVEFLLNELQKVNLVTEKQAKQISSARDGLLTSLQKFDSPNTSSSIRAIIIRAEPTLAGFLKTLNAEYTKIQDALLSMLCQVLTGNSFELMLSIATVEGKIKTFVSRLIKCNECSKQINDVPGKAATTRALLFEISFLMLCSIVQTYGPEVVLEEGGDSFFEQWVRECMPLKDRPKSPYKMLSNIDSAKVDLLLAQINSLEPDLKSNNNTKWHVACQTVMGVAKELLNAWESGALSNTDVKRTLNGLRASSCCLSVCAAAWLCSYMSITHQDAQVKPYNMIQVLLSSSPNDEMQDNFKERSNLMSQIIRKMQYEVQSKTKVLSIAHNVVCKFSILEQLQQIWQGIYQRGWINIQATQSLESLLKTGGPLWFVSNLVKHLLEIQYQEELDRSLDLIFAILHLDIENCTLDLLNEILPQYLYDSLQGKKLIEPQSSALAKLCVYCIYSSLEFSNSSPQQTNIRKRTRKDTDSEDIDLGLPATKLLRLNEASDSSPIFNSSSPQSQGTTNGKKSIILREPLLGALHGLFTNFNFLAGRNSEVSQHTQFILQFLQLIVQCGKERAQIVLQKMPSSLVPNLLKALPEFFTTDFLLRLYDVETIMGRKAIARDLCMLRNKLKNFN